MYRLALKGLVTFLVFLLTISIFLSLATANPLDTSTEESSQHPRTWTVGITKPADFTSIRAAVNAANAGDIVYVYNDTYSELQVTINKPLTLQGESKCSTILDGDRGSCRIYVQNTEDVNITGFAIVNGFGVYFYGTQNAQLTDNIIFNSTQGLNLLNSCNSSITNNYFLNNSFPIYLSESNDNIICGNIVNGSKSDAISISDSNRNNITDNYVALNGLGTINGYKSYGIRLSYSNSNFVYHNDIVGNFIQADNGGSFNSTWDNGYPSGGNYWSDYNGTDLNDDGIGEVPYIIDSNTTDRYPLVSRCTQFNVSNIPAIVHLAPPPTPTPSPSPSPSPTPITNPTVNPTSNPTSNPTTTSPTQKPTIKPTTKPSPTPIIPEFSTLPILLLFLAMLSVSVLQALKDQKTKNCEFTL